jgi:hypothetical protein
MFPIPFKQHVPKNLQNSYDDDPKAVPFCDKVDSILEDIKADIIGLQYLKSAERCPAQFLSDLGDMFAAGLLPTDNETQKRIKIYNAIQRNTHIGSWQDDAKLIVDLICGGDSSIITDYFTGDWIMWGGEAADLDDYTGTMGTDGIDDDLGLDLFGAFDECGIAGIIWIDTDNDSLTADQINQLIINLDNTVAPAYFRVVLGYIDSITGFFETYTILG